MATEQAPVATATEGGTSPTTTTQNATPDAGGEKPTTPPAEAAQPSKTEWVDYRKEQRDTQKLLKDVLARLDSKPAVEPDKAKAKTAPTADDPSADIRAELAEMKARTRFQDALDEVDIPLTKPQRSTIQKLFSVDKPTEAVQWLTDTLAGLGISKPAAAPAAVVQAAKPPPQAQTRSDTGPPGATHGELDLSRMSKSQLLSMTEEQRRELYRRRDEQMGGSNYNPFTKKLSLGKQ